MICLNKVPPGFGLDVKGLQYRKVNHDQLIEGHRKFHFDGMSSCKLETPAMLDELKSKDLGRSLDGLESGTIFASFQSDNFHFFFFF